MSTCKIRIGMKYGRWTVISKVPKTTTDPKLKWCCECECGTRRNICSNNLSAGRTLSCGCRVADWNRAHTRESSPSWKGGRIVQDGYVLVYRPEHPRAKKNGYVREHTVIMEESIDRYLIKGEEVHHINGVKDDNRLENLELWTHSQPSGQRVRDLILWAKELLQRYDPAALA